MKTRQINAFGKVFQTKTKFPHLKFFLYLACSKFLLCYRQCVDFGRAIKLLRIEIFLKPFEFRANTVLSNGITKSNLINTLTLARH